MWKKNIGSIYLYFLVQHAVLEIQLKKLQDRKTCKYKKCQVLLGSSRPDKWGPEARVRAP